MRFSFNKQLISRLLRDFFHLVRSWVAAFPLPMQVKTGSTTAGEAVCSGPAPPPLLLTQRSGTRDTRSQRQSHGKQHDSELPRRLETQPRGAWAALITGTRNIEVQGCEVGLLPSAPVPGPGWPAELTKQLSQVPQLQGEGPVHPDHGPTERVPTS